MGARRAQISAGWLGVRQNRGGEDAHAFVRPREDRSDSIASSEISRNLSLESSSRTRHLFVPISSCSGRYGDKIPEFGVV